MALETFRCKRCGRRYQAIVADAPYELPPDWPQPKCPDCSVSDQTYVVAPLQFGARRILPRVGGSDG